MVVVVRHVVVLCLLIVQPRGASSLGRLLPSRSCGRWLGVGLPSPTAACPLPYRRSGDRLGRAGVPSPRIEPTASTPPAALGLARAHPPPSPLSSLPCWRPLSSENLNQY